MSQGSGEEDDEACIDGCNADFLWNLPNLRSFDFDGYALAGASAAGLSACTALTYLRVSDLDLEEASGGVPLRLASIRELSLYQVGFEGTGGTGDVPGLGSNVYVV